MSIAQDDPRLEPDRVDFYSLAREDTGRHLLDSGGAYGRHHEKGDVPSDIDVIELTGRDVYDLRINTPAFLSHWMEVDRQMQAHFQRFAGDGSNRRAPWGELVEVYMNGRGYEQVASGNPYNIDNDLSQVYTFSAWQPTGSDKEWVYAGQEIVTVFRMHNGCDVRGGYSRPLFTRGAYEWEETPYPFCVSIGARTEEVRLNDGRHLDGPSHEIETSKPFEEWTCHYSRSPLYRLDQHVDRIFWFTWDDRRKTVVLRTKEGHLARVRFYTEGPNGMELPV